MWASNHYLVHSFIMHSHFSEELSSVDRVPENLFALGCEATIAKVYLQQAETKGWSACSDLTIGLVEDYEDSRLPLQATLGIPCQLP
jgi:hypothetical protein